jgi:ABC-type branched-subunit amino acid transport system substrate-binding protein
MADSSQEFRRSVSAGMRGPLALIPASRSRGTARPPYVIDDQSAVRLPGNATVITPALAEADLPPSGKSFYKDFERKHSRPPNRFAIFAYEATGLAVEAVERAGKGQISMRSVTGAAFGIHNRHGTIGHYDILPNGQSTLYVFATRHLRDDDIPEIPADLIEVQP